MPDKIQHTAANLQQKMLVRYGDGLSHKHNKHHLEYRQHCKTYPCDPTIKFAETDSINGSTGLLRQSNLKKMRKRDRGQFH